jgi:hypothetical protein
MKFWIRDVAEGIIERFESVFHVCYEGHHFHDAVCVDYWVHRAEVLRIFGIKLLSLALLSTYMMLSMSISVRAFDLAVCNVNECVSPVTRPPVLIRFMPCYTRCSLFETNRARRIKKIHYEIDTVQK